MCISSWTQLLGKHAEEEGKDIADEDSTRAVIYTEW